MGAVSTVGGRPESLACAGRGDRAARLGPVRALEWRPFLALRPCQRRRRRTGPATHPAMISRAPRAVAGEGVRAARRPAGGRCHPMTSASYGALYIIFEPRFPCAIRAGLGFPRPVVVRGSASDRSRGMSEACTAGVCGRGRWRWGEALRADHPRGPPHPEWRPSAASGEVLVAGDGETPLRTSRFALRSVGGGACAGRQPLRRAHSGF